MKKIIIFVCLKIAEISSLIVSLYLCGLLGQYFNLKYFPELLLEPFWLIAFLYLMVIISIIMLGFLIIKANWDWAKKLSKEKK